MKRSHPWAVASVTITALALTLTSGCILGSDDSADPLELIAEGWALFEAGEWSEAEDAFREAIAVNDSLPDARNGLGWSLLRLDRAAAALIHFNEAVRLGLAGTDAQVGIGIAYYRYRPPAYTSSMTALQTALSSAPDYSFLHDPTLDYRDLHLYLAHSHFALAEYEAANAKVGLLGGTMQDPEAEDFVTLLLAELERLWQEIGG